MFGVLFGVRPRAGEVWKIGKAHLTSLRFLQLLVPFRPAQRDVLKSNAKNELPKLNEIEESSVRLMERRSGQQRWGNLSKLSKSNYP